MVSLMTAAMDGPQWRQLPLLMTPHEMEKMPAGDFQLRPMTEAAHYMDRGWGERGERDASIVNQIGQDIKKSGYDERFPVQIMAKGLRSNDPYVSEGHHRA